MTYLISEAEADDDIEGVAVLDAVYDFLGRFVVYPHDQAHVAHVLWIAHAHLMEAWESTPRIAFLSAEPASGKTRALEVSELLVPRPVEAVNVSPAYLFRKIGGGDNLTPTILFDEIDTVFGPKAKENEEIRGLLNAGHRRGAVAGRCVVRGKSVETEEIPAYSAVALAGLGWLPDTILTRSVVIRMRRRAPHEMIEPYRRRLHAAEGHQLRAHLERWAAYILPSVRNAWPALPGGIEDRDADKWEPLISVADAAGGEEWPRRARAAAGVLVIESKDHTPSLGIRLLADLRTVFAEMVSVPTAAILEKLHAMEEAPWRDLKGKPLTAEGLARRLKQYDIKPTRIQERPLLRGYLRADLDPVWRRYLPGPPSGKPDAPDAPDAGLAIQGVAAVRSASSQGQPGQPDDNPTRDNPHEPRGISGASSASGFRGSGGDRHCEHCHQPSTASNPINAVHVDGVCAFLHHSCEGGWFALCIPPELDRRPKGLRED